MSDPGWNFLISVDRQFPFFLACCWQMLFSDLTYHILWLLVIRLHYVPSNWQSGNRTALASRRIRH